MRPKLLDQFLQLESASGIILFGMALLAMIWANSSLAFLHTYFVGHFLHTINDGLMTLFFLLVGLELKREFLSEPLSSLSHIMLPLIAAVGGMLVPAGIYYLINQSNPHTLIGWSTPVATDIAFSLGVLSLFGRRVPLALKGFLLALAIFDDIGAVIIILLFYSSGLSYLFVLLAALLLLILCLFNFFSINALTLYLLVGSLLWLCFLHAGIHPTLAGVVLAFTIPLNTGKHPSPLYRLENALHPYVAYFVMPLFALANAGLSLQGLSWDSLTSVVVLGIIAGLFIGKQIGVFGFAWLLIQCRLAKLPENTSWGALYGVSILCGIGFTMSLFLGTLSFRNENIIYLAEVRLGVLIGSLLSGLIGASVLWLTFSSTKGNQRRNILD